MGYGAPPQGSYGAHLPPPMQHYGGGAPDYSHSGGPPSAGSLTSAQLAAQAASYAAAAGAPAGRPAAAAGRISGAGLLPPAIGAGGASFPPMYVRTYVRTMYYCTTHILCFACIINYLLNALIAHWIDVM